MCTHLLLLLVSCMAITTVLGQSSPEMEVLLSIKASLIDPLDRLEDWKAPPSINGGGNVHCKWTGVTCDTTGMVQSLDLSNMNLTGRVSPETQKLRSLAVLNLCCNAFESTLPRSLAGLNSLRELDLSLNSFVGPFPAGLAWATGLVSINASGNNFSGSLPEDIANITSLESLDFRGSFFK